MGNHAAPPKVSFLLRIALLVSNLLKAFKFNRFEGFQTLFCATKGILFAENCFTCIKHQTCLKPLNSIGLRGFKRYFAPPKVSFLKRATGMMRKL